VREAIHRSHEKQKQMQALKQRHQQAVQQNQNQPQSVASAPAAQPGVQPVYAPSIEPPNKRQKIAPGGVPVLAPAYQAQQPIQPGQPMAPQQPLHQPSGVMPGQPTAGYVYSNPPQQGPGGPPGSRPQLAPLPGLAFSNGQVIMPKHTGPKPQEDHTLINCFSIEQIELHIASLNKGLQLAPQKLKTKCLEVLRVLQSHQHGWVFNSPVDPVELGLPDYFEVVKKPMDLGSIRKKLENGIYHKLEDFESHTHLTFDNAMLYNPEGSVVYNMAKEMKDKFAEDYEVLIKQLNVEEDQKRRNGEACLLCGCEKLLFEPPVFYCNGLNCPSKRIRRNSYYYIGGNNQYHWCHQCFQELKDGKTIELGDIAVKKELLTKKKNDEVHEESWVQCDRCERWVHQICALFNTRQNKDQRSEYACPRCTIDERRKKDVTEASSTTPMAEDLQRTKLSEYLENHVRKKIDENFENLAKQKAAADVS
jgi:E1A/CREB-binding protein